MDGVNWATNYMTGIRRKTSTLESENLPTATTLHGVGITSNPLPLGIGKDLTVPFHPLSSMEVKVLAPVVAPRATPQRILEGGIRKAYFGRTDGITDEMWNDVYDDLTDMPLKEAHGVWQTIANEVTVDCFGEDGKVDVGRLRIWMELFRKPEIFRKEPYCFIPHVELVRSQTYAILECLYDNRNDARDKINAVSHNPVSSYGQSIIDIIFSGVVSPFNPAVAIVASLFTLHRQMDMPTCSMDSLINEEIRNHPEQLIEIYAQMLGGGDQIAFPSGYIVELQPIIEGFITVDLKNGGIGRDDVLENIASGDSTKITKQKNVAR
ncbi:MAG: hypothetical protein LBK24_00245 [Puniceicoccales bacterium]|jgi:hypothetical protein|nr:hypothetical protein [Puniceicoccales bacterium]